MAFSTGTKELRTELNVTPLIDVVLVLLIVFIVLVPSVFLRNPTQLAIEKKEENTSSSSSAQIEIKISRDGEILVGEKVVSPSDLQALLQKHWEGQKEKAVFLNPNGQASYGRVMEIMDFCRSLGASFIGVVVT